MPKVKVYLLKRTMLYLLHYSELSVNTKQTFFLLPTQFSKWNSTMFRWRPLIILFGAEVCLVSQIADLTIVSAERFQLVVIQ